MCVQIDFDEFISGNALSESIEVNRQRNVWIVCNGQYPCFVQYITLRTPQPSASTIVYIKRPKPFQKWNKKKKKGNIYNIVYGNPPTNKYFILYIYFYCRRVYLRICRVHRPVDISIWVWVCYALHIISYPSAVDIFMWPAWQFFVHLISQHHITIFMCICQWDLGACRCG